MPFERDRENLWPFSKFSPGDQVCFEPPGREKQFGVLAKYNKKTVTVITDTGQKWNVSPHLLSKVKDVKGKTKSKVISLKKDDFIQQVNLTGQNDTPGKLPARTVCK